MASMTAEKLSPAPANYILEVANVRKAFPGVVALDNVQLRVRPGTVHALMGENGAGKSTLMKIIAGVYIPDQGEVRLKGQSLALEGPLDALEAGIAMIHQELNLMPFMTIAENIWIRRAQRVWHDQSRQNEPDDGGIVRAARHRHGPGHGGSQTHCGGPTDARDRQSGVVRV